MTSEAVLEARQLDKVIDGRPILKGLDFQVGPGVVIGLLGKNGAGKSTLIDTLLGFALPTGGGSRVFGEPSHRMSPASKARIGFVPQQDELMSLMTGAQQLSLVASFHEHWDRALIARLIQAMVSTAGPPRRRALRGRAPENRDAGRIGPSPGPAGDGRAGLRTRSGRPSAVHADCAGDRRRPGPHGVLFLAHRQRHRARGQPRVDSARG